MTCGSPWGGGGYAKLYGDLGGPRGKSCGRHLRNHGDHLDFSWVGSWGHGVMGSWGWVYLHVADMAIIDASIDAIKATVTRVYNIQITLDQETLVMNHRHSSITRKSNA